jgi:sentrin-specific protease 7
MLTFSHHCIKINVSTACLKQGAFDLEWGLDDLIDIKCQWFQSVSFLVLLLALFVFCV